MFIQNDAESESYGKELSPASEQRAISGGEVILLNFSLAFLSVREKLKQLLASEGWNIYRCLPMT